MILDFHSFWTETSVQTFRKLRQRSQSTHYEIVRLTVSDMKGTADIRFESQNILKRGPHNLYIPVSVNHDRRA